jgi:NhaP-type Na+/H+ or K+/H+ antiporter
VELGPIAIVAAVVVGYGLVSRVVARTWLTAPIVFVGAGLLLGPDVTGLVPLDLGNEPLRLLAELTLVLVLFVDATRIDLRVLRRNRQVPLRLLGLGLPLTVAAGTLAGTVLLGLPFWQAAIVAVALAPTDAALGQAVVTNERVPIKIRQALNVESGLNDGLSVPLITVALVGAGAVVEGLDSAGAGSFGVLVVQAVWLGALGGIVVGGGLGRVVELAYRKGTAGPVFRQIAVVGLPLLAWSGTEVAGGNGFIAAFVAGACFNFVAAQASGELVELSEDESTLLTLLTFLVFGGAFAGPVLAALDVRLVLYVVASLTVVRMVPVALATLGLGFQPFTGLFLGWFGPRGLASVVFALQIAEAQDLEDAERLFAIVAATVVTSVAAHGLSSSPGARAYGRFVDRMADDEGEAERAPVEELPLRVPTDLDQLLSRG